MMELRVWRKLWMRATGIAGWRVSVTPFTNQGFVSIISRHIANKENYFLVFIEAVCTKIMGRLAVAHAFLERIHNESVGGIVHYITFRLTSQFSLRVASRFKSSIESFRDATSC